MNNESVHEHKDQTRGQAVESAKTWARQGYWASVYCLRTGECVIDFAPNSVDELVEAVQLANPIEQVMPFLPEVGHPILREAAKVEACKIAWANAQAEVGRCQLAIEKAREALRKRIAQEYVDSEIETADVMCTRSQCSSSKGPTATGSAIR